MGTVTPPIAVPQPFMVDCHLIWNCWCGPRFVDCWLGPFVSSSNLPVDRSFHSPDILGQVALATTSFFEFLKRSSPEATVIKEPLVVDPLLGMD